MKLVTLILASGLFATVASAQNTTVNPATPKNGDANQTVATTGANAVQPAKGANSFSEGEARRRLEKEGYAQVADLKKDDDGIWRGHAMKDNASVDVWLDYKGDIGR